MTQSVRKPAIPMTWVEFIGPYRVSAAPLLPLNNRALNLVPLKKETLAKVITDNGEYIIHPALYSVHPDTNARYFKHRGQAVVVMLEGAIVGGVYDTMVWVHPQHRRHNLATEMAVALFMKTWADGTNWRKTPEGRKAHKEVPHTEASLAYRKKQYRTMVARGLLDPGEATVP